MNLCIRCCNGCTKRKVGCHASCQDYIQEKERNEEIRKRKMLEEQTTRTVTKHMFASSFRRLKRFNANEKC